MKKKTLLACMLTLTASTAWADNAVDNEASGAPSTLENTTVAEQTPEAKAKLATAFTKPKVGGYIIGQYTYDDQENASTNGGFNLRLVRLYVDGKVCNDFAYRIQGEINGQPGVDKGPRIVDAFVEWQKYSVFKVKLGQFKRPFSFEDPYNPFNVGFGAYSQCITKLTGFNDRVGEHSSGGRDVGLQFSGYLSPLRLTYQAGVFNGQGINHKDANKDKDLIGGLIYTPVTNLNFGVFGWHGSWTDEASKQKYDRNRWSAGVKYESDWTVRAEYIASEGGSKNEALNDKADGWYVAVGVPVTPKLKIYGKWDVYREQKNCDSQRTTWNLSANYNLTKDLKFQANYYFTDNNNPVADKHFNTVDMQLYLRF